MSRAKVLLGVIALGACYGAGVLYFYSSAASWEGAELKETEQEHALQSKVQVLETERNVQRQTIEELTKELEKTRQEALGEMEQINAALKLAHVDRDRLNILKAGGAVQPDGDSGEAVRSVPPAAPATPAAPAAPPSPTLPPPPTLSSAQPPLPPTLPTSTPDRAAADPPQPVDYTRAPTYLSAGAPICKDPDPDDEIAHKRNAVRAAMVHSWSGYRQFGWGFDELQPVRKSGKNWLYQGATIIDSMSTLKVMGLESEFNEAVEWVKNFDFAKTGRVSFFETTIRDLGGMLSAYDMTADGDLLLKAKDLGDRLLKAFDSSPLRIPTPQVNLGTGETAEGWLGHSSLLAEMGTIQLEFRQLSHYTGDTKYAEAADHVSHLLEGMHPDNGLWPVYIDRSSGQFTGERLVTFGGMGDSMYEYLLKGWLQTGKKEDWLWDMYRKSMDGLHEILLKKTCDGNGPESVTYIADKKGGRYDHRMDHLACFVPGMLALGVAHKPDAPSAARDMQTARELMDTCIKMYTMQATGIAPDFVRFPTGAGQCTMFNGANTNLQRPEALESMMIMWRVTKDQKYRNAAWDIFQAFNRYARVDSGGYSGLKDVTNPNGDKDDTQQTFWLAETLKYLYLIFSPDDVVPLDKYVLNTEAHPLLIWEH